MRIYFYSKATYHGCPSRLETHRDGKRKKLRRHFRDGYLKKRPPWISPLHIHHSM